METQPGSVLSFRKRAKRPSVRIQFDTLGAVFPKPINASHPTRVAMIGRLQRFADRAAHYL